MLELFYGVPPSSPLMAAFKPGMSSWQVLEYIGNIRQVLLYHTDIQQVTDVTFPKIAINVPGVACDASYTFDQQSNMFLSKQSLLTRQTRHRVRLSPSRRPGDRMDKSVHFQDDIRRKWTKWSDSSSEITRALAHYRNYNAVKNSGNTSEGLSDIKSVSSELSNSDETFNGLTPKEIKKAKIRIIKNLLTISFGFLLLYTAFKSVSSLQSSINRQEGLGTASLSVVYGTLIVSCLFIPTYVIKRFGCKNTILACSLMYCTYLAANLYANWYTLIPTAAIMGLAGAPLWSTKCIYVVELANQYASFDGSAPKKYINMFFGIFFMICNSCGIFGNLISAYVLMPRSVPEDVNDLSLCGINFCVEDWASDGNKTNSNLKRPSEFKIHLLFGIYLSSALSAVLLVYLVLDHLRRGVDDQENTDVRPSMEMFCSTFRQMKNPYQVVITPFCIYRGLVHGFKTSEFTLGYITCAWGIQNIGTVMIAYGLFQALACLASGPLANIFGRILVFTFAGLTQVSAIAILFLWSPTSKESYMFFIIAVLMSIGDGIIQSQLNSFFGFLFDKDKEAAFSNLKLWDSVGYVLIFASSKHLCMRNKLEMLTLIFVIGMLAYYAIEVQLWMKEKSFKKTIRQIPT